MALLFIFFHMKVCCVYSLESPHGGNSNEYKKHPIIYIKRKSLKIIPITIMSAAMGYFLGTQEITVVN